MIQEIYENYYVFFYLVLCAPLIMANGLVEYSKSAFKGDYLTDTVATITCKSGYVLRGPVSRTCHRWGIHDWHGSWTEQMPRCDGYYP